jgi:serine/threonine protein kinase
MQKNYRYEVIETADDILLIMEYVAGGELFEYIVSHGKVRLNCCCFLLMTFFSLDLKCFCLSRSLDNHNLKN